MDDESRLNVDEIKKEFLWTNGNAKAVEDTFVQILYLIAHEHRYGKLLNRAEDISFLMKLFHRLHFKYSTAFETFYNLKKWDFYTFIHSFDVFILGTTLAKKHELPHLETVALGYLFHDIGKMKISQDILKKRRKLTNLEYQEIQRHTIEGENLLCSLGLKHIADYARFHHERLDGTGYPDQLKSEQIPEALKVLHIVDVYSALTLKRPYKDDIPADEAIQILLLNEKKYDTKLLFSFLDSLNIYPSNATVLLSNSTTAKIKKVDHVLPTLPFVERCDCAEEFLLPIDYSVTVSKVIDYHLKTFQLRYHDFLQFLIEGKEREAFNEYNHLVDGFRIEDIFIKIILPTYWRLIDLNENAKISQKDFCVANELLSSLIDTLENEITISNHYEYKVLLECQH